MSLVLVDKPIALGFTSEIYAWNDGQVLKLFHQGIPRHTVEAGDALTRTVRAAGLPVPPVGDIVEIEGRFGFEIERRHR